MPGKLLIRSAVVVLWIVITEIFLRYSHELLPRSLSNEISTGYHDGFTGIYQYDPEMSMNAMKPDFTREMHFNGYRWLHKTDWIGFRNPINRRRADIVLLGDSMIYGHGVDEPQTVRHELESIVGLPVYNMGMQGASAHQEYQIMNKYVLRLEPKHVFLFFLTNDIRDLTVHLTDDQMRQFVAQQSDIRNIRYFDISYRPLWKRMIHSIRNDLYVVRSFYILLKLLRRNIVRSADAAPYNLDSFPLFMENPRLRIAMEFHLDAVKKMHRIAADNNILFTNVFLYTGQRHFAKEEPVYEKIIQDFCHTHDIPFLNLHEIIDKKLKEGEMLFLEKDGHFSARGAQLVAAVLASYIKKH